MTRFVEWSAVPLAALAVACLLWWVVAWSRGAGLYCQGPRWRWWHWVSVWHWVMWRGCGYDLRGLGEGAVVCPECGREHSKVKRRRRTPPGALGRAVVLLVVALACWKVTWIRYGGWVKYTPTAVLIGMEWLMPTPRVVWRELFDRQEKMGEGDLRRLDALAVHALGNDSKEHNAAWAVSVLDWRGDAAAERLEAALFDEDWQRRQLAGVILRRRYSRHKEDKEFVEPGPPSERLLEVSVEGMRDDRLPHDGAMQRTTWISNGMVSFYFLLEHVERATPLLARACESDDRQQACLAAAALGFSLKREYADVAVPRLVESLRSDERGGNAKLVMPAILGFGQRAREYLVGKESDDQQQAELCAVLVKILDGVELGDADYKVVKGVTDKYRDPRDVFERVGELGDGFWY